MVIGSRSSCCINEISGVENSVRPTAGIGQPLPMTGPGRLCLFAGQKSMPQSRHRNRQPLSCPKPADREREQRAHTCHTIR